MKTIILCGGQGTRIREFTETRPKPMIEIGGRPILWHIMSGYAAHGLKDFVLCLGYKGEMIKRYFLEYSTLCRDFTVTLGQSSKIEAHGPDPAEDWRVTLADTGEKSLTGTRLARAWPYTSADPGEGGTFALTYGDAVSDIDLAAALAFHRKEGRLATITGVRPPGRFGELEADGSRVTSFWEKPAASGGWINGGFFFMEPGFRQYLPADGRDMMLEHDPLRACVADGQLSVYRHEGFWQCMDVMRDWQYLETLWEKGEAPWKTWA